MSSAKIACAALMVLVSFSTSDLSAQESRASNPASSEIQYADLGAVGDSLSVIDEQMDLANVKLAIDSVIDPKTDAEETLGKINGMIADIRASFRVTASSRLKLDTLLKYLYQSGSWNNNNPFHYDLDDPLGTRIHSKLLVNYLASRKGNCVSMPILFVILGQKLGLDVTLATAPTHLFVKFRDEQGQWLNVETTSGGFKLDSSYQRELDISDQALANGVYLRPLSKRESAAAMLSTLMEFFRRSGRYEDVLAVADLALAINPTDVTAMLHKGSVYYRLMDRDYMSKYPNPDDIPLENRGHYEMLSQSNLFWFGTAESLGWAEPSSSQGENYLQVIERAKNRREGNEQ